VIVGVIVGVGVGGSIPRLKTALALPCNTDLPFNNIDINLLTFKQD
jgi:hypothetical protein